jgi:hypothetical protein
VAAEFVGALLLVFAGHVAMIVSVLASERSYRIVLLGSLFLPDGFTSSAAIRIYFCDPKSPWQHAISEITKEHALEAVSAQEEAFCGSPAHSDSIRIPRAFVERLTEAVCCAANWIKSSVERPYEN